MPSLFSVVLLPRLLMRKKFLSFGKWPVPLLCLVEVERPEKFRFSEETVEELLEPKSCVMVRLLSSGLTAGQLNSVENLEDIKACSRQ